MKVMVELKHGVVRTLTRHIELVGLNPMVAIHTDSNGKKVRLGDVRRVYTEKD